jgi:hypothetical protein
MPDDALTRCGATEPAAVPPQVRTRSMEEPPMPTANIFDPASIEAIYPRDAYEAEAAQNAVGNAEILRGVRIDSAVDEKGDFTMVRAARDAGEAAKTPDALFIPPMLASREYGHFVELPGREGGVAERQNMPAEGGDSYAAFIDRVIEAARAARFPERIGRGDDRFKGFHGG